MHRLSEASSMSHQDELFNKINTRKEETFININNNSENETFFSWENISVSSLQNRSDTKNSDKKKPQILSNVSGWVRGGEIIGILGASGAGKSTLLNALVGVLDPRKMEVSGQVKFNNCDRSKIPSSKWKQLIGYVEQDDLLYPNLTVIESLERMAALQIWKSSEVERKNLIIQLLESLSLIKCAGNLVGVPGAGISGGERKRLATALKLISNPSLLFMDEPTSGLDAHTALQVVSKISEFTRNSASKAVLMTIHQPRLNILRLFSRIILLSSTGGKCIFFGNVDEALEYFSLLGYPCPTLENPGDHFLDMITEKKLQQEYPVQMLDCEAKSQLSLKVSNKYEMVPLLTQMKILLWQNWLMLIRDQFMVISIFLQAFIFAILIGFTIFQLPLNQPSVLARFGVLFFLSMNTLFSIVQPIIIVLPLEKGIVARERFSNTYSPSAALISKICILLPLRIAAMIFLTTLLWLLAGLHSGWDRYGILIGIMSSLSFVAVTFGLFIGAIAPSLKMSQVIAPLIISVFMVYGGNMSPSVLIPKPLAWLQYISPVRYAFISLCQNEFRDLLFSGLGYSTGEQVLEAMDMLRFSIGEGVLALVTIGCVFFIASIFFFSYSTKPRLNLKIKSQR